ncbi:MAG: DUF2849 domain-containing protein [Alphaproteobacteria bacterium]|nr:DUF2849 domain-containing protein [Alphaproteobacteria bacterium]
MKVVTANLLCDGRVAYLASDGAWTDRAENAVRLDGEDADAALFAAASRAGEVADAYLVEVDEAGRPVGREGLRERIRNSGPTGRTDLGKQAART